MSDPGYLARFKHSLSDCEVRAITLDNRIAIAKAGNGNDQGDTVADLEERREGYTKKLVELKAELKELEKAEKS